MNVIISNTVASFYLVEKDEFYLGFYIIINKSYENFTMNICN